MTVFLFQGSYLAAQNRQIPLTKMVLTQWTGDDGLISNNLTSVNQTSDGFIWVTSFNGMHLFDGRNFKLYDKSNLPILSSNAIYGLTETGDGSVLLSTQGSGIVRFFHGQAQKLNQYPISSLRKIVVDNDGRIWCATNSEGVWFIEKDSIVQVKNENFEQIPILDIYPDAKGTVWIGTEGNGLMQYRPDGRVYSQITLGRLLAGTIGKIGETKNGDLWVGTSEGLFVRSLNGMFDQIKGLESFQINDFVEGLNGHLWIATEQGLVRMNLISRELEIFNEENGFPGDQISSILLDHEGSFWLSTKKAGLIRLNSGTVYTLDKSDGIQNLRINIVAENDGWKYVGSDDGSISMLGENGEQKKLITQAQAKKSSIRDIAFQKDETIWVASNNGLHQIKNGIERVFTYTDGLTSNFVRRIVPVSDGSIWLGTRTGGLLQFRDGQVVKKFTIDNGLGTDFVLSVEEDNKGNIVVGTHSGGLSVISDGRIVTYRLPEMKSMLIFNIFIDVENRYWLSTNTGIYLFEEGILMKVNFKNSFKTETFFDILADRKGNVWMTTNIGIVRVAMSDFNNFAAGNLKHVTPELFDHTDGMANRECTGATRATLTASGEVWVPTINGVATINPSNISRNMSVPSVAIIDFIVDGEEMVGEEIVIKPGKFRFEMVFAASSYIAPDKVSYRYRLSGVENEWISTSFPKVEYTSLKPGEYKFSVIASNNPDSWNNKGAELEFIVKPYIYEAWWFKVLLVLAIIFSGYFLFVWRVRHVWAVNRELRKLNEELDRFVYSVSHDLRAPLTSILGLTHIAKASKSLDEKDKCVDMIDRSAVKLDGFIGDIIDYSRNQRLDVVFEEINMREELESIVESIRYLDEEKKVECHISTSVKTMRTDIRRLRVVLKNVIANAFSYHDFDKVNPYVHIDCWEEGNNVAFSIADNGRGMKESVIENIFKMFYRGNADSKGSGLGLYIAKENIQKLQGDIKVASKSGVGTSFTLMIPKG